MTPTRLIMARHGQAHCNVDGVIGGARHCRGLTDHGRHQARQLAERLHTEHRQTAITAAYTTPLRRARETADVVAARLGLPVHPVRDLREPDYGSADGQRWSDVVAAFGRIPAQHPDQPIAPGAETWHAYLQRCTTALHSLLTEHVGETVLIIGHGETVTAAAHHFLGLDAHVRAHVGFAVHYASITCWEQQPLAWTRAGAGWRWFLTAHNDTGHLVSQPESRHNARSSTTSRA